jgi:hypothetical protein
MRTAGAGAARGAATVQRGCKVPESLPAGASGRNAPGGCFVLMSRRSPARESSWALSTRTPPGGRAGWCAVRSSWRLPDRVVCGTGLSAQLAARLRALRPGVVGGCWHCGRAVARPTLVLAICRDVTFPPRPPTRRNIATASRAGLPATAQEWESRCRTSVAPGSTPARLGAVARARATAWRGDLWDRPLLPRARKPVSYLGGSSRQPAPTPRSRSSSGGPDNRRAHSRLPVGRPVLARPDRPIHPWDSQVSLL